MVIIDEVYRTKRAVFPDFTDNPTNTVAVIGVVLDGKTDAVVASGKQFAVRGGKPSHSLVHHRLQVVGRRKIPAGLCASLWHVIFGKQFHWLTPCIAVL